MTKNKLYPEFESLSLSNLSHGVLINTDLNKAYCKCSRCRKQANVDTSICLTSYPPQYNYHCPHCENHGYVDCDEVFYDTKVAQFTPTPISVPIEAEGLSTSCLICGESVPAKTFYQQEFVICEKCKKAILKVRKMLEEE